MKDTQKNMIATIFLKDGMLVQGFRDHQPIGDLEEKIRSFHDNCLDKIILYDLSDSEEEHEKNIHTIKRITGIAEIPVYAGGNIKRIEDVKKIIYAGCKKVILNSLKPQTATLARECAERFGKERIALSIFNVDVFFKQKDSVEADISELIALDPKLIGLLGNVTDIPYSVLADNMNAEQIRDILASEDSITGISCKSFADDPTRVPGLKQYLKTQGISADHLSASMDWSEFKLNSDGLIPVIVQDYQTNDVLMLAYMNQEAYEKTLEIGKMTYYSRSRKELWIKGLTSGHFQYVKSLSIDCDKDTILAKVSQLGAACHTGNRSCFYTSLAVEDYMEKNPLEVFQQEYNIIKDRKAHPKTGSYTNHLFDQGLDKILGKLGGEATEIIIAAKNPETQEIKYEITDFLYYLMVMMVERGVSLEEVLEELAMR